MLEIFLSATDELPAVKLCFEHSLLSISKWESIHTKPFYGRERKTEDETKSYIYCMLLNEDPPMNYLDRFTKKNYIQVADYINSPQSATTFGPQAEERRGPNEVQTSELIYYWMVQFGIPFHPAETWHINRLLNLIKIAGIKQSKPKKMDKKQLAEQYRAMNEQRRQQLGTAG